MRDKKNIASDLEIALFLAEHIKNPCGILVGSEEKNIREFYIREAKRVIKNMGREGPKNYLQSIVNQYSK